MQEGIPFAGTFESKEEIQEATDNMQRFVTVSGMAYAIISKHVSCRSQATQVAESIIA